LINSLSKRGQYRRVNPPALETFFAKNKGIIGDFQFQVSPAVVLKHFKVTGFGFRYREFGHCHHETSLWI
jgi:hypothetical protein